MKLCLIQIWLGQIPDYFWYHYETTKNLKNIDFVFFTDQEIILNSKNYKVYKITKKEIEDKLSGILNQEIQLSNNKKVCDLKACYGELFYSYIKDYDYFGCYDIDTLFGDINKFINPYLREYDFISTADEVFHNRISGPFLIVKNTEELRTLYKSDEFITCLNNHEVNCFEESFLNERANQNYKVKLIYSTNVETHNGGKNTYESIWLGGKVFVNGQEKMIYHFYRKNQTKFERLGNIISAKYDKKLVDDFVWVAHFSMNYETLIPFLIESIKKYSNRKCIFYTTK